MSEERGGGTDLCVEGCSHSIVHVRDEREAALIILVSQRKPGKPACFRMDRS